MKKPLKILVGFILLFTLDSTYSNAQSQEAQQLLLNVEKLTQFKNILADMKQGYQVISAGYNAVKDVSQGNFSLHKVFLDGLMLVSPEVKKYRRIADIITIQTSIVTEYKNAFARFKQSGNFNNSEISYLSDVYSNLLNKSVDNLDELATVITSNQLRMSDDERIQAIDRIYLDTQDKITFLRNFNKNASLQNLQRAKEKSELQNLQKLYQP